MNFKVVLLCEAQGCQTSVSAMPNGTYPDMRTGRAVLMDKAKNRGWKTIQPGGTMPDGAFNRRGVHMFCAACVKARRGLKV